MPRFFDSFFRRRERKTPEATVKAEFIRELLPPSDIPPDRPAVTEPIRGVLPSLSTLSEATWAAPPQKKRARPTKKPRKPKPPPPALSDDPERWVRFDVLSSDGETRYEVVARREPSGVRLTCTCEGAQNGRICKHRLTLALGDETFLVGPREHMPHLLRLLADTPLPNTVRELRGLERERAALCEKIDQQMREVKVRLVSLMS